MNKFFLLLFTALNTILFTGCTPKESIDYLTIFPDSSIGYTAIVTSNPPKAYMLLFPGFGESLDDLLASTDLPIELARHNIAVFIPMLQNGSETYGFSNESQEYLTKILTDIENRYNLHNIPYFTGGFSMGGATAVKYAEHTDEKPAALFIIDSPLDYNRFLYATKRDIDIYHKDNQDSIYAQLYRDIESIKDESPYFINDSSHSAIMSLKHIPIRVYIEPAEDWWINNRQTDALGLNIIDATCFVNDLRLIGNDNAQLIVTQNKGFRRANNMRHPHSWTIVDNKDLIKWLESTIMK